MKVLHRAVGRVARAGAAASRLTVRQGAPTLNCAAVSLQSIGQLGWIAHRDHVTTVNLLDFDGEALAGDSNTSSRTATPTMKAPTTPMLVHTLSMAMGTRRRRPR